MDIHHVTQDDTGSLEDPQDTFYGNGYEIRGNGSVHITDPMMDYQEMQDLGISEYRGRDIMYNREQEFKFREEWPDGTFLRPIKGGYYMVTLRNGLTVEERNLQIDEKAFFEVKDLPSCDSDTESEEETEEDSEEESDVELRSDYNSQLSQGEIDELTRLYGTDPVLPGCSWPMDCFNSMIDNPEEELVFQQENPNGFYIFINNEYKYQSYIKLENGIVVSQVDTPPEYPENHGTTLEQQEAVIGFAKEGNPETDTVDATETSKPKIVCLKWDVSLNEDTKKKTNVRQHWRSTKKETPKKKMTQSKFAAKFDRPSANTAFSVQYEEKKKLLRGPLSPSFKKADE